jgi:RND family efflux transporter MFP subunit
MLFSAQISLLLNHHPRLSFAALLLTTILPSCKPSSPPAATSPPPHSPVTVATPIAQRVIDWDEFTGRLASREQVDVRAQVSGYLTKVSFTEGAEVKTGDLLFSIDPRPFETSVQRAEAVLAEARTLAELAAIQAKNAEGLRKDQAISLEESERRLKTVSAGEAAVRGAEAALRAAQLDLEFTQIRAPITGRISYARVTEGNLVTGGSKDATILTTIVALDPIYCYIEVDERSSLKYRQLYKDGQRDSALFQKIPAEMALVSETNWPHLGQIDFVDNALNPETGTILARGVFPNQDRLMAPGFFAKVRIPGSAEYNALLIRDAAIADDQGSSYVWVVDAQQKAVYRPVELGPLLDGLRIIRKGLASSERIIVEGLMAVRNGMPVQPKEVDMKLASPQPVPETPAGSDAKTPPAPK